MKISELYKTYPVILTHATRLEGGAGGNKCIDINASIAERIKTAYKTKTSISCSSFKIGENLKNIFGPVGLLLKNGNILAANEFDLGSEINEDCERTFLDQGMEIGKQVNNAINLKECWNEFIVQDHIEFGIYLCHDDLQCLFMQTGHFDKFFNDTKVLKLPYFIIEKGQVYLSEFDEHKNLFMKGDSLTLDEIKDKYCG